MSLRPLLIFFLLPALCVTLHAGEARPATPPKTVPPTSAPPAPGDSAPNQKADSEDLASPAAYDDVVHELMRQLLEDPKDAVDEPDDAPPVAGKVKIKRDHQETRAEREERQQVTAQDAARKLASLGKRSVPALTQLLRASIDKPESAKGTVKAAYYSVWALSRIRTSDAARALLPILTNPAARSDLRHMAVEAAGWEKNEEGVRALQKIAANESDLEMRKKALSQLTMIPEFWQDSEPIFLKALSDPDGEIRTLAAKACHFSHIFLSANDTLVDLLERDSVPAVRTFAMLTLGRLKYKPAEPALVRVLDSQATDEKLRKVALNALSLITEIPFSKTENALAWWKRDGETKFAEAEKRENAVKEQLKQLDESAKHEKHEAALKLRAEAAESGASVPPKELPFFAPNPDAPRPLMALKRTAAAPSPEPVPLSAPPVAPMKTAELLSDELPHRTPVAMPEAQSAQAAQAAPGAEGRARNLQSSGSDSVRRVPNASSADEPPRVRQRKSE